MTLSSPSVAFLPVDPNPYQRLLAGGLEQAGVRVIESAGLPTAKWLRSHRADTEILHFHWLHKLYMARYRTPIQAATFFARFRLARQLGYKIVWTAHNILPHKLRPQQLHLAIRRLMMQQADAVIAHCEAGKQELLSRFPRSGPIYSIPIGTYAGIYPITETREAARKRFGLDPEQYVYLALGNIAPYKGLERFLSVFKEQGNRSDIAIIAGNVLDEGLAERLRSSAAADPRVRLDARFIPDNEMQYPLLAADALVAPFEEVLTSSSILLGLSHGLPVVAPALGCLPELVSAEAGILYDPADSEALGRALLDVRRREQPAMRAAALALIEPLDWNRIGQQTADIYRACMRS